MTEQLTLLLVFFTSRPKLWSSAVKAVCEVHSQPGRREKSKDKKNRTSSAGKQTVFPEVPTTRFLLIKHWPEPGL